MTTDWDLNRRNQNFRGCVAFELTNGTNVPSNYPCASGFVQVCWNISCAGNQGSIWVFHRNGDNNTHNLAARAFT